MKKNLQRMVALSMSIAIGVNMVFSGNISSAKEEKHEYLVLSNQKCTLKNVKEISVISDNGVRNELGYVELTKAEAEKLEENEEIVAVEKNVSFSGLQSSEKKNSKENVDKWNLALINADKVKVKGKKKAQKNKIKVAIMDSGVEYNTTKQSVIRVNMLENEIAPYFEDGTGHGTSIADVVSEINPCAEIYSVKVLNDENNAKLDTIVKGIYWCIENDIDIINMSFGSLSYSKILEDTIDLADEHGILMIAAAGNDNIVEYPAKFNDVISVAGVDQEGMMSEESVENGKIDVLAPGENVVCNSILGSKTLISGTSIAAAHATGACSVLMQNKKMKPELIKKAIKASVNNNNNTLQYGILDVNKAVKICEKEVSKIEENEIGNNEKLRIVDSDLFKARWNGAGHNSIIQTANQKVGFSTEELEIIKQASINLDRPEYRKYFKKDTELIFHGRFNYVSTIEYLFKVAFKLYYEGGSVENACNAYPYSPHTYYPDVDQKLMKTIDTAILYMTKNNLGFSSSTLATNKQQALRIVGMIMHTIGDTYAHDARVPVRACSEKITKKYFKTYYKNQTTCTSYEDFCKEVRDGMMIKRIRDILNDEGGSKLEDTESFYRNRFVAAQTASKEILVYFKKRQWPEKTEKIFETAAIRDENHALYQECTLGYLYKHVNNLFGKDRALGIGYYSFYPRTGEYFTNK